MQLVHMDLKPANILLQDKNCLVAKIADLGLSSYLAEGSLLTNPGRGASAIQLLLPLRHFMRRLAVPIYIYTAKVPSSVGLQEHWLTWHPRCGA